MLGQSAGGFSEKSLEKTKEKCKILVALLVFFGLKTQLDEPG